MLTKATGSDALYRARRGAVNIVDVPKLGYLLIEGRGAPEGAQFAAVQACMR